MTCPPDGGAPTGGQNPRAMGLRFPPPAEASESPVASGWHCFLLWTAKHTNPEAPPPQGSPALAAVRGPWWERRGRRLATAHPAPQLGGAALPAASAPRWPSPESPPPRGCGLRLGPSVCGPAARTARPTPRALPGEPGRRGDDWVGIRPTGRVQEELWVRSGVEQPGHVGCANSARPPASAGLSRRWSRRSGSARGPRTSARTSPAWRGC